MTKNRTVKIGTIRSSEDFKNMFNKISEQNYGTYNNEYVSNLVKENAELKAKNKLLEYDKKLSIILLVVCVIVIFILKFT